MANCGTPSRAFSIERVYTSCPERLLKALRVLLSDKEISILVDYAKTEARSIHRNGEARPDPTREESAKETAVIRSYARVSDLR
jgi:hypothetical protein